MFKIHCVQNTFYHNFTRFITNDKFKKNKLNFFNVGVFTFNSASRTKKYLCSLRRND